MHIYRVSISDRKRDRIIRNGADPQRGDAFYQHQDLCRGRIMKHDIACAVLTVIAVIGFLAWLFIAAIERDEKLAALYDEFRAAQFSRAH